MTQSSRRARGWLGADTRATRKVSRRKPQAAIERLEERALLASILDIDPATHALTFTAASGVANNLTVSLSAPGGTYTFNDSADTITLGAGATSLGWTGDGTNTVQGPDNTVGSLAINTVDGADTTTIRSEDAPTLIAPGAGSPGTAMTVVLGGAANGTQGLLGSVSVQNALGLTKLTVDDMNDPAARTATLTSAGITGLSPGAINFNQNQLSSLTVNGGSHGNHFNVEGTPGGSLATVTTNLNTGFGNDQVYVLATSGSNGATLNINGAGGSDVVNLGLGNTSNLLGPISVHNSDGFTTLTVDDSIDPASRNVTLSKSGSPAADTIAGIAPAIISANDDDLSTLNIGGSQGGGTYAIDDTPRSMFLADVPTTLHIGTGPNTVNVLGTSGRLAVEGSGGSDAVTIGNAGRVDGIKGAVTVSNAGPLTALTVDDSASTVSRTATLSATQISGLAPSAINYTGSSLKTFAVKGGSGGNTFTVASTVPGLKTELDSGSGNDTVNVQAVSAGGPIHIDAGAGSNTVTLTSLQNVANAVSVSGAPGSTTLNASDSADTIGHAATLSASGGVGTLTSLSALPVSYDVGALSALNVTGGSGADTLTVDFGTGNPIPVGGNGLAFDGGAGNNTLNLQNGEFASDTSTATGPGAGRISLDGSQIGFSNLRPINDTTAAASYTFNAPASSQAISVNDGPVVLGFQTVQIASADTPAGFELVNLANKGNVTVSATGTGSTYDVVVNNPTLAAGLTSLAIVTGAGSDQVTLKATPPGIPTTVNTGAGNDVVNVSAAGLGAGATTSLDGGGGVDDLNINAGGAGPVSVTPTTITINGKTIGYANFEHVDIANTADLPLTGSAKTINATQNVGLINAVVASFTDADSNGRAGDFVASIDWGDGTSTAGVIVANGTTGFDVFGSHTYTATGSFPITTTITDQGSSGTNVINGVPVTVSDSGGQTAMVNSTATVAAPPLPPVPFQASSGNVLAVEGQPVPASAILATFAGGTGVLADYSATIDWGDGTTTPGTIVANGTSFLVRPPAGSHTYAEEGLYQVLVTVTDTTTTGPVTATALGTAIVKDAPLLPRPMIDGPVGPVGPGSLINLTGTEGTPVGPTVASFIDTNPLATVSDFTATINWGDGLVTAGKVVSNGIGGFLVTGTHTYEEGTFPVSVSVADTGGSTLLLTGSATIADATLTAGSAVAVNAVEGTTFTRRVATFTDANAKASAADFVATITWGDGTTSAGVITQDAASTFSIDGTHTYGEEGSFPINVAIKDVGGGTASASTTATVADAPLIAAAIPVPGVEGTAFNGPVAIFADRDPAGTLADYSATINWGDGTTSPGTIAPNGPDGFVVNATHTYREEAAYPVSVTINDAGGAAITVTNVATVADAPPNNVSPINVSAVEGQMFMGPVAAFSEIYGTPPIPEPEGDFSATIDWGDGTPATQGALVTTPGGIQVVGIHTWTDAGVNGGSGSFPITVTIHDDGGTFVRVVSTATVLDVPIHLTGQLNPASDTGRSPSDAITKDAEPNFFGISEPGSVVRLFAAPTGGLGLFPIGSTVANASGGWSITSAHLADGSYTISAWAIDASGHTTAQTQVLPNAAQGPLVIDTVGPKITNLSFDRQGGRFAITFQDDRSGLDPLSLIDGANYAFDRRNQRPGQFLITSLTASPSGGPTASETVTGVINFGRPLRGGQYTLTVHSTDAHGNGIRDVAGNGLDGEFYGFFPSGNSIPGGDFVAILDTVHNRIFAPGPVHAFATPNVPPGFRPSPTIVRQAHPSTGTVLPTATHRVSAASTHSVHDLAIEALVQHKTHRRPGR